MRMYADLAGALVVLQLRSLDPIIIRIISSAGGGALESILMYHMMRTALAPIYTIVEKRAASAAVTLFLGGSRRLMCRDARLMTHAIVCNIPECSFPQLGLFYKDTAMLHERMIKVFQESLGVSRNKAEMFLLSEHNFSASKAKHVGFAHKIISPRALEILDSACSHCRMRVL